MKDRHFGDFDDYAKHGLPRVRVEVPAPWPGVASMRTPDAHLAARAAFLVAARPEHVERLADASTRAVERWAGRAALAAWPPVPAGSGATS